MQARMGRGEGGLGMAMVISKSTSFCREESHLIGSHIIIRAAGRTLSWYTQSRLGNMWRRVSILITFLNPRLWAVVSNGTELPYL